jgi:DNA-binding response OmpR family regulator
MKILYVEDEERMAKAVAQLLKKNNYSTDICFDGDSGLYQALTGIYDIIILDLMLPKLDGISLLTRLRQEGITAPVLLLTAKGDLADKVSGLDSGADDYLAKPFHAEELLARIRALGRRSGHVQADNLQHFGDLEFNPLTLSLFSRGESFRLTLKEGLLLELLINNINAVVPSRSIIEKLWGFDAEVDENYVRVYISFLRKKLAQLSSDVQLEAVRGVGYRLVTDTSERKRASERI